MAATEVLVNDMEMKLPRVEGRDLNRQSRVFPAGFTAPANLVFIAFLRRHQDDIDAWVPAVAALAREFPDFDYYEFPTLPPGNVFYRTMLNEGMRAGIPSNATRERTITLYLDKEAFRRALDIPNEQEIWLYLFDRQGKVLWRVNGRFSQEKAAALREALAAQSTAV